MTAGKNLRKARKTGANDETELLVEGRVAVGFMQDE